MRFGGAMIGNQFVKQFSERLTTKRRPSSRASIMFRRTESSGAGFLGTLSSSSAANSSPRQSAHLGYASMIFPRINSGGASVKLTASARIGIMNLGSLSRADAVSFTDAPPEFI